MNSFKRYSALFPLIWILFLSSILVYFVLEMVFKIPNCDGTWEKIGQEEVNTIIDGTNYISYRDLVECKS